MSHSNHLRPLNILFITGTLASGGAERLVFEWCRHLLMDGHRCAVGCLIRKEGQFVESLEALRVPIIEMDQRLNGMFGLMQKIKSEVRSSETLIVHSQCGWSLPQQAIGAHLGGAGCFILTLHNVYPKRRGMVRFRQRLGGLLAAPFIDRIVGVSKAVTNSAADWTGKRHQDITTITNGIDLTPYRTCQNSRKLFREKFGIDEKAPLLVNVASLSAKKDQATLLKSMKLVLNNWPEARLVIVGDGPLRQILNDLSHELGLANTVLFVGHQNNVPEILSAADVFVLSSLLEGLPLVAVEAGAAGLPVVATKVGGVAEVVRHGESGLLVPLGQPEYFAEAIDFLLRQEGFGRRMGLKGKELVFAEFDIRCCYSRYLNLYNEIIAH